jgi:hypothetical protein
MMRFLDRVFLLRPTLFYPIWTFFLAGYWGGQTAGPEENGEPLLFVISIASLSCIMGCVFILNQIMDIETDRANSKLFLLANDCIPVSEAVFQAVIMAIIGLAGSMIAGIQFAITSAVLFILSGWLYNYPPARWKDRPLMGMLTNAAGGAIIYYLGWVTACDIAVHPLRIVAYTLAGGAVFLNTTLPDAAGDQSTGKITFGVRYGLTLTVRMACIFEIFAVGFALVSGAWLLFITGMLVLPLFIHSAIRCRLKDSVRATKFSVLALACAVCIVYPLFCIPVVFIFFFSKWYYRRRFDFDYPSLKPS